MRTMIFAVYLLALSAPLAAQQPEPPKHFATPEELQEFQTVAQQAEEFLRRNQYADGVAPLKRSIELLETWTRRFDAGEVDMGSPEATAANREGVFARLASNRYNLACSLSKTGKGPEAVAMLAKAVEAGFLDVQHMRMDSDLDPIRETEGFKAIVAGLDHNDVSAVYAPEGLPERSALLVVLHEARGDEKKIIEEWKSFADARKLVLVAPRGPVTVGRGEYDWIRNPSDPTDATMQKISDAIRAAAAAHPVDVSRIYVAGIGNGGKFALSFSFTRPDQVRGVVAVNAYFNQYELPDHFPKAVENKLSVCLIHGAEDPGRRRAGDGLSLMTEAGVRAKLVEFPGGKEPPKDLPKLMGQALDFIEGR